MGRLIRSAVPPFDRGFFRSPEPITSIGEGRLGGKALGLLQVRDLLEAGTREGSLEGMRIYVPKMTVVATGVYDDFVQGNGLTSEALEGLPDDRVARAFLGAELPAGILGDLRAIVEEVHTPLAIRSSSLLEDAMFQPFAGVYETKMVPNNQPDADTRFTKLAEALKFVYASTWFRSARAYLRAAGRSSAEEKMAVIIQEVVGRRTNGRYYPHVSGVGRSYNFFPAGGASPRDGVVNLALGLGKTIVDGGTSWIYSPARPKAPAPFGSVGEMLRGTQTRFWAVNMGTPPAYDPLAETEYLVEEELDAADYDGTLEKVASTYDAARDRIVPGTGSAGPRLLNFAPILSGGEVRLNAALRELLRLGEEALDRPVEIEFAVVLPQKGETEARLGFLQLRPMLVSSEEVELAGEDLGSGSVLVASGRVMGNGVSEQARDIVYVRPDRFKASKTPVIAAELEEINRPLQESGRPYLLVGFGRWGSSDPWLGIPVNWGQISGARVIVESTLPDMNVEPSQGAHFFHNLVGFKVFYFCVQHDQTVATGGKGIDWRWLESLPAETESEHVRHVRLERPLRVKVDGRTGSGAIWKS